MSKPLSRWRGKCRAAIIDALDRGDDARACSLAKALALTSGVEVGAPSVARLVILHEMDTRRVELDGLQLASDWLKGEIQHG